MIDSGSTTPKLIDTHRALDEMPYISGLDARSQANLMGVHEPLCRVIQYMALYYPFGPGPELSYVIIDGLRDDETQEKYYSSGKSWTLDSYHLTGHAIDIAVFRDGDPVWQPLDDYFTLADRMFQAAHATGVLLQWGGHFVKTSMNRPPSALRDCLHFQIPRQCDLLERLGSDTVKMIMDARHSAEQFAKPAAQAAKPTPKKRTKRTTVTRAPAPEAKQAAPPAVTSGTVPTAKARTKPKKTPVKAAVSRSKARRAKP